MGERSIRPLGDRIVVRRVDVGEKVLASGIVLPATREQTIATKADYFRAEVLAMSDEAKRLMPDLSEGEEVLVYAYSGTGETVFTGEESRAGLMIRPDDILCAVSEIS